MTANASFFFEHAVEIKIAVALGAIALGFLLTSVATSIIDVVTRLAGSADKVRDGLTVRPSAFGTR